MRSTTWVVYSIPLKDAPGGVRAVCEQREWEAMDRAKPAYFTLIRGGIAHEGEAERLARGAAGEDRPRSAKHALAVWPGEAAGPPGPTG